MSKSQKKQARKPFRENYAPSANLWASHPKGINQVGCIFSAQGFEVDYIGVIMGPDITYDPQKQSIVAIPGYTHSVPMTGNYDTYIRNIYRVLLSRGRKGCFVYCCHKELSIYLKSVIPTQQNPKYDNPKESIRKSITILKEIPEQYQWTRYLPFFEMRAACGYFGDGEPVIPSGWIEVSGLGHLNRNMFIVRASGNSMEPRIHDNDYCIFKANPAGSRENKIVLVQHRTIFDPENGGAYSIKKYSSRKRYNINGEWAHETIVLLPLNSQYKPIEINSCDADDFQIIGEFISTITVSS